MNSSGGEVGWRLEKGEAGWAWFKGGGHGDGFVWVLLSALFLIILDVQEGGVEIRGLA